MKILVLPLFQFPTGHTKAAEAVIDAIYEKYPGAQIEMIDFLSYCHPIFEKSISTLYLKWIQRIPSLYQLIYHLFFNNKKSKKQGNHHSHSMVYFQRKMKQLIETVNPSLIICTHAFPSNIIGKLKRKDAISQVPVVNVYTDFFMNNVWGKDTSEYHLVPHQEIKDQLVTEFQRDANNVFVTGIPIHSSIKRQIECPNKVIQHVLIAGGNTGFMEASALRNFLTVYPSMHFTVLCGNNKRLFASLQKIQSNRVTLLQYVFSRDEMNALYDRSDAIITKPGGVTITEVICKRIPVFVSHCLPGPEEENYHFLLERGIIQPMINRQIEYCLTNIIALEKMKHRMDRYWEQITCSVSQAMRIIIEKECLVERTQSQV